MKIFGGKSEKKAEKKPEKKPEVQKGRRQWVKNFAIIFLAIMLLLTFFSNTIMNYSLAQVDTKMASSGTLTENIRESGTVKTLEDYEVTLSQTREVSTVEVKQGDTVAAGDVLFTLTEDESEEIEMAQETLDELRELYEDALLDASVSSSSSNTEVQSLRDALSKAKAEKNALGSTSMTLSQAQTALDNANTNAENWTATVATLEGNIAKLDSNDSSYIEIRAEVLALEAASSELSIAQSEYEIENSKVSEDGQYTGSKDINALRSAYESAQQKVNNCTITLNEKKSSLKISLLNELDAATTSSNEANAALASAQSTYEKTEKIKAAEDAVSAAQDQLNTAVAAQAETQKTDSVNQTKTTKDLQKQKEKIAKQEEKVEELKEEFGGTEVTAKYGGIISQIAVKEGSKIIPDDTVAIINVTDKGYTAEISVETKKAEGLKVGKGADILNTSWDSDISANISGIKNDPENPGKAKIITLDISGEPTVGESLSFSIPISTKSYDAIVPKNAVSTDSDGDFVLVLTSKSSPLGTRYVATRTSVTVMASDNTQSAVSGIFEGDYVITTTSSDVTPGDYVRLSTD